MLTARQREAMWFIQEWITTNKGVAPTFEQIRLGLNLSSKSHVARLVNALVERGYLRRIPNRWQALFVCRRLEPKYFMFDDETKTLRLLNAKPPQR